MLTKSRLAVFSILIGLALLASTAHAQDWQNTVNQAGGTWAADPQSQQWSRIFANNSPQVLNQLPPAVKDMLSHEVKDNPWIQHNVEMKAKLGEFRPQAQQVFDLPFIPIPADKMGHAYEATEMSAALRSNLSYSSGGKKFYRYFFHPLYADKYADLIQTYGVKYEYQAVPTSSPRSMIVWKKGAPQQPIWVKVSIHRELDSFVAKGKDGKLVSKGLLRIQKEDKARRSAAVNEAFASAPRGDFERHKLAFFPEPASLVPAEYPNPENPGKMKKPPATIFRDIPTELTTNNDGTRYVPAFTFITEMKKSVDAINTARRAENKKPINVIGWMTKGLVEPLSRAYVQLGVEHGLVGDLHTQNFLIEVKEKQISGQTVRIPTGKVMVKDLDGFRIDVGLRARNGRSLKFLEGVAEPFEWTRYTATQGNPQNGSVFYGKFNKQIRNVNGFNTVCIVDGKEKTVHATPAGQILSQMRDSFPEELATLVKIADKRDPSIRRKYGNNQAALKQKLEERAVEQVFDGVVRAQFNRQTGIKIDPKNWSWNGEGAKKLNGYRRGLNEGLDTLREGLFKANQGLGATFDNAGKLEVDKSAQQVLASHWNRLTADKRTWHNSLKPAKYRLIQGADGTHMIEALSSSGRRSGWGIFKSTEVSGLNRDLQGKGLQPANFRRVDSRLGTYSQSYTHKDPMGWVFRGRAARPATRR